MKKYLSLVFMISMMLANAQQQTFSKVYYNSVDNIQAYDLMRSADNHYFIAGTGFITKVDSAGNIDWTKNYYTGMQNKFNCIIPDPDGNPVVAGCSNDGDAMIMKIDQNGDTLWARYLDFGTFSETFTVSSVHDSGFVLCGYVYSPSAPNKMFVARTDQDGNLIWSKTYTVGNHANYAYSVKETPDSGFIVAGYAENYPPYTSYALALKLDENGVVDWGKGYGDGNIGNIATDVLISGNDFVFSCIFSNKTAIIKTDSAGSFLWAKDQMINSYGFYLSYSQTRIRRTHDDRILLMQVSDNGWGKNMVVCDSAGNQLSANFVSMNGAGAVEAADSGFMIVGNGPLIGVKSDPKNIIDPQFVLVKTDSTGNSQDCNIQETAEDNAIFSTVYFLSAVAQSEGTINNVSFVINDLSLLVANECVGFIGGFDESEEPSFRVYPNPSNGAFSLQFDNPQGSRDCVISVYNSLGDCVYTTLQKIQNEILLDLHEMNSGLYYVVVSAEGESMSRVVEIQR